MIVKAKEGGDLHTTKNIHTSKITQRDQVRGHYMTEDNGRVKAIYSATNSFQGDLIQKLLACLCNFIYPSFGSKRNARRKEPFASINTCKHILSVQLNATQMQDKQKIRYRMTA